MAIKGSFGSPKINLFIVTILIYQLSFPKISEYTPINYIPRNDK